MEFMLGILTRLGADPALELGPAVTAAYKEALQPFHGFFSSNVFSVGCGGLSSKSWWGVVREKVTGSTIPKPTRCRGEPMTTPTRGGGSGRRGPRDAPGEGRVRGGRGARKLLEG